MTNEQAIGYATCAVWAMFRDESREPMAIISNEDFTKLIREVRDEMDYQFDVLTEKEVESKSDRIMKEL
jgi:hypothetical protein